MNEHLNESVTDFFLSQLRGFLVSLAGSPFQDFPIAFQRIAAEPNAAQTTYPHVCFAAQLCGSFWRDSADLRNDTATLFS